MGILTPFLDLIRSIRTPPAPQPVTLPRLVTGVAERVRMYGDPGIRDGAVDEAWRKTHLAEFHGATALPGIPPQWYFQTHKAVVPHLRRALERARREAPEYEIQRAASFVFRHQRHDIRRPLSMHAWGLAVDIDAPQNQAREFGPGKTPRPFSAEWAELWPHGLPEAFVEAFEAEGWTWGGRWRGFVDPMHLQWDRVPV